MSADNDLYSPISNWREQCTRIIQYIEAHRAPERYIYRLDRPRPCGALLLRGMLEAFWEYGQRYFWRLQYPNVQQFEFNGMLSEANEILPHPAFGVVDSPEFRSIEDVNLVQNTYTSYFIFENEVDALCGASFVNDMFHP